MTAYGSRRNFGASGSKSSWTRQPTPRKLARRGPGVPPARPPKEGHGGRAASSAGGSHEAVHRAVRDLAAVVDARIHRLAEVEADEDAREPVLLRRLGEAAEVVE